MISNEGRADTGFKGRALSLRRAVLLATTIAGLGAGALFIAPGLN